MRHSLWTQDLKRRGAGKLKQKTYTLNWFFKFKSLYSVTWQELKKAFWDV